MLPRLLLALIVMATQSTQAQTLPPIYDTAAVRTVPVTTVADFAPGTFLENIAVDERGLFVNSYLDGRIYRFDPRGVRSLWATIDGTIAGIALDPDGSAVVSGWIGGKEPAVFRVDADGHATTLLRLVDGQFPNGIVRLTADRYLVADSYRGVVWQVDLAAKAASVWIEDDLLKRADATNPTPAVNGLKVHDGALYASNTAKQLLVRIPIEDGRAGRPTVVRERLGIDDFDFGPDGALYGATHVYDSLVRVGPDGVVTILAGLAEGMAGSTAVAARTVDGRTTLYVVTNGGMSLPPPGGVQRARVLRVELPASR